MSSLLIFVWIWNSNKPSTTEDKRAAIKIRLPSKKCKEGISNLLPLIPLHNSAILEQLDKLRINCSFFLSYSEKSRSLKHFMLANNKRDYLSVNLVTNGQFNPFLQEKN